jgi:hypothetical protein
MRVDRTWCCLRRVVWMRCFELGTLSLIVYCLSVALLAGRRVGTRCAGYIEKDDGLYASPDRHVLLFVRRSRYIGVGVFWRLYMPAVLILRTSAHIMTTGGYNGCAQQAFLVVGMRSAYMLPSPCLLVAWPRQETLIASRGWGVRCWRSGRKQPGYRDCGSIRLCLSSVWLSKQLRFLVEQMRGVAGVSTIQGLRHQVPLFLPVALYARSRSF